MLIYVNKADNYDYEKEILMVMSNNTAQATTRRQRYNEKTYKKSEQYLNSTTKITKKGCKKWIKVNTEDYPRQRVFQKHV